VSRPARPRRAPARLDLSRVRTVPLGRRPSKVAAAALGCPVGPHLSVHQLVAGLPDILAAHDLRDAVARIARAIRRGKPVVLGMGAHAIKVGLGPLIVDLIARGRLAAVAMNGACLVHDFELAWGGRTSEDVGPGLELGLFGMARETGAFLNRATREGAAAGLGLGLAVGRAIERARLRFRRASILAAAARAGIPATVHVAIGTDIIHMHPDADGAAIGESTLRDFRQLAAVVARLAGGVYLNLGSAVVLPEVFVKALNLARNLGHPVRDLTTIDMDFIRHYRPAVNVIARPTAAGGRGIQLTGHHEIMFPLLWAAVEDALAWRRWR
jgi:deoxyhypusine synthase